MNEVVTYLVVVELDLVAGVALGNLLDLTSKCGCLPGGCQLQQTACKCLCRLQVPVLVTCRHRRAQTDDHMLGLQLCSCKVCCQLQHSLDPSRRCVVLSLTAAQLDAQSKKVLAAHTNQLERLLVKIRKDEIY